MLKRLNDVAPSKGKDGTACAAVEPGGKNWIVGTCGPQDPDRIGLHKLPASAAGGLMEKIEGASAMFSAWPPCRRWSGTPTGRRPAIGCTAFYHHFPKERIRELRG